VMFIMRSMNNVPVSAKSIVVMFGINHNKGALCLEPLRVM
jgi:hypothetical protein